MNDGDKAAVSCRYLLGGASDLFMRMKSFAIVAALALSTAIAGCSTIGSQIFTNNYGPMTDAGYQLPRIPIEKVPFKYRRQVVSYDTDEKPGTIVVDTQNKFLYYVMGGGEAMRYGIGVGREGFTWAGTERISRMAEWPDWHPPEEMIERQPYLPRFMAGGEGNPLGARALYLGKTLYRIHGTNQPSTIGTFVSSGCVRLTNEDIQDLYDRVKVGSRVVVLPGKPPVTAQTQPPAPAQGLPPATAQAQQPPPIIRAR
jgi:lipoprotein-anchoring transpeptidase ErfK/SrfK